MRTRKTIGMMLAAAVMSAGMCAGAKEEIVLWTPFTGSDGEILQNLVDEFNAEDPAYEIKNLAMASDDMYTKLPTVIASGKNVPDMGVVHYYKLADFEAKNIIVPVNPCMEQNENLKAENYISDAWNCGSAEDGMQYSVPLDVHGTIVYYNKDLMEKYAPDALSDNMITYEEMLQMGEAAAEDGILAYGGAGFTSEQFYSFLGQAGSGVIKDNAPTIDTQEARDAIAKMQEIYDSGYSTRVGDDNYAMFASGKVIFTPEGTWTVNAFQTDYPELNYGVTNMMSLDGTCYNQMNSHQFVIYNKDEDEETKSEKQKVMADFLEFIRENSDQWAKAGHIPASLEVVNSETFAELPQSFFLSTTEEAATLHINSESNYTYCTDAVGTVLEDILIGNLSVDEGLERAQKEAEDKIAAK